MVAVAEIEARIRSNLEPTSCEVTAISEEERKYSVAIVSHIFEGMPLLKRHRMVNDLFKEELLSGDIHALTIVANPS
ncbi:putative BolA-like protein [Trypanosoma cruzi]|nr:putative BolA-like protein [Trypanosoma cruzi]